MLDVARSHDAEEMEYDLCGGEFESILLGSRLVVAKGWKFRAHGALRNRRAEMVNFFTPKASIQRNVQESVARARNECDILIGLHVRRGDYASWLGGKFFYGLDAYANWLVQAQNLWRGQKVGFLICSNENVGDLLRLPSLRASPGPGDAITDLYALAACDFLIGPPSTFTLWASFYGGAPLHMLMDKKQAICMEAFAHHERF